MKIGKFTIRYSPAGSHSWGNTTPSELIVKRFDKYESPSTLFKIRLTSRNFLQTVIFIRRNGKISWNCDYIAEKFGNLIESPVGPIWTYSGILGDHTSV